MGGCRCLKVRRVVQKMQASCVFRKQTRLPPRMRIFYNSARDVNGTVEMVAECAGMGCVVGKVNRLLVTAHETRISKRH